jgi:SARP family transcriptional regulator, regulator of embCAB operon
MQAQRPVRICVLGELRVSRRDGTDVRADEWRTAKTRDLLRILALGDGRPIRADLLTEMLWPDAPSVKARNRLRTALSQIRMTLGDHSVLRRHPEGYQLTGALLDAHLFAEMARRAATAMQRGDHAAVIPIAVAAERLYRGDFHADDDDSAWAITERHRFQRLRRTLACDAAEAALMEQRVRDALAYASLAVQVDPMNETAHRLLMRAQAAMGEVPEALRDFESYRRRLADELGVDPSPETRALHLELLRSSSADRPTG